MKQSPILIGALFCVAQVGFAGTICATGTLASYIALGSSGCTIGTNTFSQFTETSFLNGATNISPSLITVTPVGGTLNPGLNFTGNLTATNSQVFDGLINYFLTGNTFTTDTITLSNATMAGNGAVTDIQNFCGNSNFTAPTFVSGCPGGQSPGSPLLVFGNGSASAAMLANSLGITHNITIDGGGTGTASGLNVTDSFSATAPGTVPEPSSLILLSSGVALALASKRRRSF